MYSIHSHSCCSIALIMTEATKSATKLSISAAAVWSKRSILRQQVANWIPFRVEQHGRTQTRIVVECGAQLMWFRSVPEEVSNALKIGQRSVMGGIRIVRALTIWSGAEDKEQTRWPKLLRKAMCTVSIPNVKWSFLCKNDIVKSQLMSCVLCVENDCGVCIHVCVPNASVPNNRVWVSVYAFVVLCKAYSILTHYGQKGI